MTIFDVGHTDKPRKCVVMKTLKNRIKIARNLRSYGL